jgi:TetR/AcrR family transcriptional regulator
MPRKSTAKKPRSPGRPSASTADLRAHLIDVAVELFATQGIEATPLRTIAKAAGVTPALLHYYFGSKPQLVESLITERLMPVVAELRFTLEKNVGDSGALIEQFVTVVFGVIERHAWFPALWAREVLSGGGALRELIIGRVAPQVPRKLEALFAKAQRAGKINRDLDTRLLVVSLLGQTMFLAASAPIWRRIFSADDIDTAVMRRHAVTLLSQGIRP